MTEPRCADCRYFHKLKHNFEVGKGYEESHCCTIMLEHDFEPKATTKEYWILHGFTDRDEHIDYYFNLECVAWVPLPLPWEGE